MIETFYGNRVPDDLEGQVEFWKSETQYLAKIKTSLEGQVRLLQQIIERSLSRSCNCD